MPDDIDDALIEQVDAVYEALLDDTRKLLYAGKQAGEMQAPLSVSRSRTVKPSMH